MSKKVLLVLSLLIILVGVFRFSNQRSLSFHFVDEEDHMVTASFMNQGLKLYKDLSVNHSPVVYLGSQALQKITKPNSLFQLIKWHRLGMFGYAALWSVLLTLKFGLVGLIFVSVFEFLKFYGLGNLWLMESLAVYPLVYLMASLVESSFKNIWPKKYESIFLGGCSFLVMFNLVPLWPMLSLVWLVYLFKNRKQFWWQLSGLLIPTVMLFLMISPVDWFRETIFFNVKYAMPQLSVINSLTDWLKIIFFPFLSLLVKNSFQAQVFAYLFTGVVVSLVINKKIAWLFLIYGFLVLANLRVPTSELVFYEGFHLLPFTGVLLMVFLMAMSKIKNKLVWLVFLIWGLGLMVNKNMPYFWKTDTMSEYHINYSVFDDLNYAVRVLANQDDGLAVLTSESLVYWNTGVRPATRQVVYYAWEHDVPELREDYKKVFYNDFPPEFIYGSQEKKLVEEKYIQVLKNDQPTQLYIREDRAEEITQNQAESLGFRGFRLRDFKWIEN